jgi:hypothetical protein
MIGREYSTELRLGGFLPKCVMTAPDWLACPAVRDICSVSSCVSPPPAGWIDHWLHNEVWLYDAPELARRVMDSSGPYTLFAYRLSIVRFVDGRPESWEWRAEQAPPDVPPGYRSLGFDVAGKLFEGMAGFGCSPLSCNHMASEYPVNAHCLLDDRDAAFAAAERFSVEKPEPGTYFVAEVLVEGAGPIARPSLPLP